MKAAEMKVTVHAQTGWLQSLIKVAQMIERVSPRAALLWLRVVRPVCFIRLRLDLPGHPGKWRLTHMPVADGLRVKPRQAE